jgi:hypothetical protein
MRDAGLHNAELNVRRQMQAWDRLVGISPILRTDLFV